MGHEGVGWDGWVMMGGGGGVGWEDHEGLGCHVGVGWGGSKLKLKK